MESKMAKMMKWLMLGMLCGIFSFPVQADSKLVYTPYKDQKVIFDFYFDEPEKIASALYWIRSWLNPLMKAPYSEAPEFLKVVVMIHGTELVTLAKKNEKRYQDIVDRMRYYHEFGFKFKVCELAAGDFDYKVSDFQDFVEVVPSAMTELVHWQQQGYGLITPTIYSKKFSNDEIR
jgi:intracellular sulfur oxidation DsrE/DsrF family protein